MKRHFILFIVFGLTALSVFAGGGWPQPMGEGYFKLSQNVLHSRYYFAPDGSVQRITTTGIYTTSLYGEYGFTPRLTGILYAPLFIRSTINKRKSSITGETAPGDSFQGIGDIELGVQYGLLTRGPVVMSASLYLGIPSGKNVGGNTELLQTGDGEFNQMLQIDASHSFYPAPFYASLLVAYNNRNSADFTYQSGTIPVDYSDEAQWGGEIGWTPGEHWAIALKWEQIISLRNGNDQGETGNTSIFGNNVDYFSITPEINYRLNGHWGISAALGTAVSGRNILASPNFGVGIFYQLKK